MSSRTATATATAGPYATGPHAAGRTPWRPSAVGAAGVALLGLWACVGMAAWVALQAGASPLRVAVLLALAPVAEEVVFRAGLQEALLRQTVWRWHTAPWLANAATALAFALTHAQARGSLLGLAVVAPALLLGSVYGAQRRLRWCVLLHAVMNALWLLAGL